MMRFFVGSRVMGLVLALGLIAKPSFADDFAIGFVDMQRALQSVQPGLEARSKLELEFNAKKRELQAEESNIKKMSEDFKAKQSVLASEKRSKKESEIQERIMKFQQLTQKYQVEIQQKEHDLTQPILNRLKEIIGDIAKSKKYRVVMAKNENLPNDPILYSEKRDDLTDEAIKQFDSHLKSKLAK